MLLNVQRKKKRVKSNDQFYLFYCFWLGRQEFLIGLTFVNHIYLCLSFDIQNGQKCKKTAKNSSAHTTFIINKSFKEYPSF